ncbi:hypothetical protein [Paracoccus ravus]|uniref:hypothetical protein n=1 Tax=Paracoccus ravus TaxID=2447760 RepID=UPI00106E39CA|nr:hypothetical protein [Paracoccus ravus]
MTERSLPMIGDIALGIVERIEHFAESGFRGHEVIGLEGSAQQHVGRASHVIRIAGRLAGASARDDLEALQTLAATPEQTQFTADIVTALDLQAVVLSRLAVSEVAGAPGQISYQMELIEAPPLPPPAQVSGFGGLDDFGFGDLGFDTDIMGDLADLAGDIAGAVDGAMDAIAALDALAGLGDLNLDGPLAPLNGVIEGLGEAGRRFTEASRALGDVLG